MITGAIAILNILLFAVCWLFTIKIRELVVLAEAYRDDYYALMEKHDHVLTQLGSHGLRIRYQMRSACYIEVVKEGEK